MPAIIRVHARRYQIKITLCDVEPRIWRRVLVPASMRLSDFHRVIQISMGWSDSHLHEFQSAGKERCGIPDPDVPQPNPNDCIDDMTVLLPELLGKAGARAEYVYDLGDWWRHELELEKISESDPAMFYPVCLGGQRRCPPEDASGACGYQEMLEAIGNKRHKRHKHWVDWIGSQFDPEAFSLEKINKQLARLYRVRNAISRAN
jgi:Plasmid pRiA4b ORF-3-like protein